MEKYIVTSPGKKPAIFTQTELRKVMTQQMSSDSFDLQVVNRLALNGKADYVFRNVKFTIQTDSDFIAENHRQLMAGMEQ